MSNTHKIRKIRYRDLSDYISLRNNCSYKNPADAPVVQHVLAEKTFFILNKLLRYFFPIFSQRYNIFGYYIGTQLIGFHHSGQLHPLWPYNIQHKTKKKYTQLVAVEHSHRRKGIGKKLSAYASEYYSDYDIFNKIPINYKTSMGIAKSLGFQPYDMTIQYLLHVPKMKHRYKKNIKLFSISNNQKQINQIYALYKTSLLPEIIKIEEPLLDYFKIPPLYRINVFLFNLLGIYNEGRFVRLNDSQTHVKAFIHIRNYIMTYRSEMLIFSSEKLNDQDLTWVRRIIDTLASMGQKKILVYVRKHQTNIQDALKSLNFTQKDEWLCFVRKVQQ